MTAAAWFRAAQSWSKPSETDPKIAEGLIIALRNLHQDDEPARRPVFQQPRQVFSLLRVVADLRAARTALSDGRRRLGGNLSFPGELQLNPSV